MREPRSLLELLHPSGAADRVRVLGDARSDDLVPHGEREGDGDLVIVRPAGTSPDGSRAGDTIGPEVLASLRSGGIVAAIGPEPFGRALAHEVSSGGLVPRLHLAHVRLGETTVLASLEGDAVGLVRSHVVRARAAFASNPLRRGSSHMTLVLAERHTEIGRWLCAPGVDMLDGLVLRPSWRGPHGTAIVTGVVGGRPRVIGKLGLGAATAHVGKTESEALNRLGPTARSAGALVPDVLDHVRVGDRTAALLSVIPGGPLAAGLRGRVQARTAARRVAAWLARWCSATRADCDVSRAIQNEVEEPLAVLASELSPRFVSEVRRLAAELNEGSVSLCARHGDLTLWNVLATPAQIGIVDWEGALGEALPLTDLPYLLVDAVAAERGYRSRARAYAACFAPGGRRFSWAARLMEETARSAGLGRRELELATHACWLGHAADERRRGIADGPFLRVLRLHAGPS